MDMPPADLFDGLPCMIMAADSTVTDALLAESVAIETEA